MTTLNETKVCEDCGKKFHNRSGYYKHKKKPCIAKDIKICDICGKEIQNKSSYYKHKNKKTACITKYKLNQKDNEIQELKHLVNKITE